VSLGKIFGSRVQTNIYLTPPGAQGFKPHWDTHDVFVLQVSGRKLWSIYDTKVTLPLKGQQTDPAVHQPGPVTEEFELDAGSVVYIPRGLMHSARSSAEASLHITLGITAFTWADFFVESVAAVALEGETVRQNLPMGFASGSVSAQERARLYQEKLSALQAAFDPAPVWRHFQDEVLATNTPLFTNLLGSHLRADPVTVNSTVRRRTDMLAEVERGGESCVVRFGGTEITLPGGLLPAVEMATTADTFTVQELPDCIDAEGKVTLVTRLLKEGLLFRDPESSEKQQ
jgi:mannose-6-phosphate isomerase-like protein (cupin superfamily)